MQMTLVRNQINAREDDDDDEYDDFYGTITQHMPLQGRLDKDRDTSEIHPLEIM